ncbi:DUF4395 domain-containing protein [Microbacterium sp. cx-59]|uniref:DUF4395 domain-containing protein n=1 Tax=Microbacterium sp. cx-59 TaxID=2891207 RepID=UPI001E4941E2|nr:DUF4395 domain-containing protein [Microbacterium sp. cx-59]MCC4909741.1 DUF4395 domain-containing protein [Microbacterium sp. cx-59]
MSDQSRPPRIDVRGPRFVAGITAVLLLVDVFLGLVGVSAESRSFGWFAYQPLSNDLAAPGGMLGAVLAARASDPAFILLAVIAALFVWGVVSPRTAPWGVLYRKVVQPRLRPATEFEDPRPPRFAQGVGLFVTVIGLVLHLSGVPWALPIAAAAAFMAAFLNAVFGLCLGCQLYLVLQRAGLIGRTSAAA